MSVYGLILSFSPLFKFQQHFWALQNTQIYSTSCSKWLLHSLVCIQENCSKKKRISGSLRVRPEVIPKIHQQTKEASRQQHELELKIKAPERSIPSTSLQANFFCFPFESHSRDSKHIWNHSWSFKALLGHIQRCDISCFRTAPVNN